MLLSIHDPKYLRRLVREINAQIDAPYYGVYRVTRARIYQKLLQIKRLGADHWHCCDPTGFTYANGGDLVASRKV